jgi:CheY-like chemotaxis protein
MSPANGFKIVPREEVPAADQPADGSPRQPLVLVVDDEKVIADTLSVILRRSGYTVMTAYNGEHAMELAELAGPDLLLSDVMMGPGMDGTELAVALVEACPGCKVLLFSGHAATRDLLDRARDAGHDFTLLNKPLHPADLLARLSESFPRADESFPPAHADGAESYRGVA